jgi:C-terminal binding protein
LGRIGTEVAVRAKALGWGTVLFFDPYLPSGVDRALGIGRVRTKEELFERSDTLSLHCPLTKEMQGVVGEDMLRRMKNGSVLVNTSRGGIVDLDALEAALKSGKLAGAALDVIPVEAAPRQSGEKEAEEVHPLIGAYRRGEEWLKGRLVITPHVGFYSPESWEDIRRLSCETMRDVLLDGLRTNVIRLEDE